MTDHTITHRTKQDGQINCSHRAEYSGPEAGLKLASSEAGNSPLQQDTCVVHSTSVTNFITTKRYHASDVT